MQYLIEAEKDKDKFVAEMLRHFSFIKTHRLTKKNLQFLYELQSSAEQVKKAKTGKVKLQSAKEFLNEL
ncbi:MAG: hypothetical protein K2X48_18300 [Chitinophagaceae bacterium]|nr:hypothetical protein [Chitinophagaceae bacterium]